MRARSQQATGVPHSHLPGERARTDRDHCLMLVLDRDGTILDLDPNMAETLGKPAAALKGTSLWPHLPAEKCAACQALVQRVMKERQPSWDASICDGRWNDSFVIPRLDDHGQVLGATVVAWDITERKQAEQVLQQQTEELQDLYNHAACGYHSLDKGGLIVRMNDTELGWLGYSREELVGKIRLNDLLTPDSRKTFQATFSTFRKTGVLRDLEITMIRKDGTLLPVLVSATAVKDREGNFLMSRSTTSDLTERKQAEEALRASEAKHRLLFESAGDALIIVDTEGRPVAVNHVAVERYGYTRAELMALTVHQLDAPEQRLHIPERMAWLLKEGALTFETVHLRKDGSPIPTETNARRIEWDEKPAVLAICRDITERSRVEARLRESEANFRTFFESIGDLAVVATREGRLLFANSAVGRKLGYSAEELVGMHVLDLHPADKRPEAEAIFGAMFRGERDHCPLPLAAKGGNLVPVETRVWFGRWNGMDCVFGISKDLTAEQEAHQRFERLFHHNPAPMAITALPGRQFFDVNSAFLQTLGYSRAEVIGKTAAELGLFPHLEQQIAAARTLEVTREIKDVELQVRCKDGAIRDGVFFGELISTQGKEFHLTVMVDVTERKRLEERLRQSQKMEAIGHLTGGMAHEFNNILAALTMNLGLLQMLNLEADARQQIREMDALCQRAAELIRQLLAFSRQSLMQLRPLDLAAVVARQCQMLDRLLGERITVQFVRPDRPSWVEADRVMMEQVVLNLCLNARDAMPDGGELRLELADTIVGPEHAQARDDAHEGRHVRLSVSDTGRGIDERVLKRLFEPFFTTKDVGQGPGLGLATVRGIAQQHNGWVEVESRLGRGSTFRVYLPALDRPGEQSPVVSDAAVVSNKGTILLVEDEPAVRKMTRTLLVRNRYHVLEAANGNEALRLWEKHHSEIELLYTDMVMPGNLTGLQLAEQVLAEKPDMKVIITSGYNTEGIDLSTVAGSSMVYLPKPCLPATLISVIQQCLQRTK